MTTLDVVGNPAIGPYAPIGSPVSGKSTVRMSGTTSIGSSTEYLATIAMLSNQSGTTDGGGKVSLYVGNEVTQASGNAWSINSVLVLDTITTSATYTTVQGYELDVQNNTGYDLDGVSGRPLAYGLNVSAGGSHLLAGAVILKGTSNNWKYGFLVGGSSVSDYGFYDQSTSTRSIGVTGSHAFGIDLASSSYYTGAALIIGNSGTAQGAQSIAGVNNSGTAVILLTINSGNNIVIGSSGITSVQSAADFWPSTDNTYNCGQGSARFKAVYAVNGTIQTSDPDLKTDVANLPPMLPVVLSVDPKSFRWKSGGFEIADVAVEEMVHATETVTEEVTVIEVRDGIAVQFRRLQPREAHLYDEIPIFDESGAPVMVRSPPRPALVDAEGNVVRREIPGTERQATHRVPTMVSKTVTKSLPVEHPGRRTHLGFMAPDLKQAFDRLGMDFGGYVESPDGYVGLRPDQQIPILWKAVQEIAEIVSDLQKHLA